MKQLGDHGDPEIVVVNLSTSHVKELMLCGSLHYITVSGVAQIVILNGFKEAGIVAALEGQEKSAELSNKAPFTNLD